MSKRLRQISDPEGALTQSLPVSENAQEESVQHPGKYTHLDTSTTTTTTTQQQIMHCTLPPHEPQGFDTYEDYELHYHKQHVNRCLECGKNFPTDHFLSLHIAENHDPLTATKRDRGDKTFCCFVEDCDKVCGTWQKRRLHLVDKHMFPKDYDFFVVNHGLDRRVSLLLPAAAGHSKNSSSRTAHAKVGSFQNSSTSSTTPDEIMADQSEAEVTEASSTKDVAMDDIVESMASLKFVPKSVAFGRGRQRGGLARS